MNIVGGVSGADMALRIAAMEVETENQMAKADRAAREAAREARKVELQRAEEEMREKASVMMAQGAIGGALKVGSGVAQFHSGANQLDGASQQAGAQGSTAGQESGVEPSQPEASQASGDTATPQGQVDAESSPDYGKLVSTSLDGAFYAADQLGNAIQAGKDAEAAKRNRLADQHRNAEEDKSDAIRRREDAFSKKMSVLEQMMNSDRETERVIIRG